MRVTRFAEAPTYHPPLHRGVKARRLQGLEAGPTARFWTGLSVYAPGGAAEESPTAEETVYTVIDGELVVRCDGREETLRELDSAHLPKGAVRSVENCSGASATLLVVIALPQETQG